MPAIKVSEECYEEIRKEAMERGVPIKQAAEERMMAGKPQKRLPPVVKHLELIETINRQISLLQDLLLRGFWTSAEKLQIFSCIDRLKSLSAAAVRGVSNE